MEDQGRTSPAPADCPVLDPSVLAGLREILEDDVDVIVEEYLRDAPRLVTEATTALAAGDMTGVRRAVHSLKSTSAAVGAQALSWVCAKVEKATREGDDGVVAACVPLLAALETEAAQAITASGNGRIG